MGRGSSNGRLLSLAALPTPTVDVRWQEAFFDTFKPTLLEKEYARLTTWVGAPRFVVRNQITPEKQLLFATNSSREVLLRLLPGVRSHERHAAFAYDFTHHTFVPFPFELTLRIDAPQPVKTLSKVQREVRCRNIMARHVYSTVGSDDFGYGMRFLALLTTSGSAPYAYWFRTLSDVRYAMTHSVGLRSSFSHLYDLDRGETRVPTLIGMQVLREATRPSKTGFGSIKYERIP